jgi:hypothetical protein
VVQLAKDKDRIPSEQFSPKGEGLSIAFLIAGLATASFASRSNEINRHLPIGGHLGAAIGDMGTGSSRRLIEAARRELGCHAPCHETPTEENALEGRRANLR